LSKANLVDVYKSRFGLFFSSSLWVAWGSRLSLIATVWQDLFCLTWTRSFILFVDCYCLLVRLLSIVDKLFVMND
jgi:hypothetical protein